MLLTDGICNGKRDVQERVNKQALDEIGQLAVDKNHTGVCPFIYGSDHLKCFRCCTSSLETQPESSCPGKENDGIKFVICC